MVKISKVMIETNFEIRKVYTYTADLVMKNQDLTDPSVTGYSDLLVASLFKSVNTISQKATIIESSVKSSDLNTLKTINTDNKLNLRLGLVNKTFTLQESLNLVSSNLLPIARVPASFLSDNSGVIFILGNAETISDHLSAISGEIDAYFNSLQTESIALALIFGVVGLGVLFLAGSIGLTALSLKIIRKELLLSLGFERDDCKYLRDRLDQLKKLVTLASERLNNKGEITMDTFQDQSERFMTQQIQVSASTKKRKHKGIIYTKLWILAIRRCLLFTITTLISVLLLRLFSTSSSLIIGQHGGLIKLAELGLILSRKISSVKAFAMLKYLDIAGKQVESMLLASMNDTRYSGNRYRNPR